MKNMMTTRRQSKSLSLTGGGLVSEQLVLMPSYSPNALPAAATGQQQFPWDDDVNDINTPDIDPSFFDGPFKKMKTSGIDPFGNASALTETDDQYFGGQLMVNYVSDDSQQSSQVPQQQMMSYEDMNLCQLLSQTNVDINGLLMTASQESADETSVATDGLIVSPNDVMNAQYISSANMITADEPVLHYLQPKSVESIGMNVITTASSQMVANNTFMSPTHSTTSYLSSPSPALSYTSTTTSAINSPSTMVSMDTITSDGDSNTIPTIEGVFVDTIDVDMKPDLDFLQPTVINDHLYTRASTSGSTGAKRGRKPSSTTSSTASGSAQPKDKHLNRTKNNVASKKSRVTKRDKQKMMDEQIQHYRQDNEKCKQQIEQMEKEIEWCKNYLFKKVVASSRT